MMRVRGPSARLRERRRQTNWSRGEKGMLWLMLEQKCPVARAFLGRRGNAIHSAQ